MADPKVACHLLFLINRYLVRGGINLQNIDPAMAIIHFTLFGVIIVMILIIVKERKKPKK